MLFRYSLSIPANTPSNTPETLIAPVSYGVLRNVIVSFPPGCAGLARLAVLYHEHQIIPTNPDGFLAWDDYSLSWPEHIKIFVQPFEFKLVAWNLDDTFDHEIVIHFNLLPPPTSPPLSTLEKIGRIFNPVINLAAEE